MALWSVLSMGAMAAGIRATRRWPRAQAGWRRRVLRAWGGGLARALGIRISVSGPVPRPPFFLVSNHLGYVDILVYAAVTGGRFVAKREVRGWPGLGFLAAVGGTIFIDRRAARDALRVQELLEGTVAGGEGLVVFAEATSSAGREVLPFRPALLEWAARSGQPVHYASISYRTPAGAPPADESVCWWGEMTFGPHLTALSRLPAIEASVTFGTAPIAGDNRRELAERLRGAVAAQFIPVGGV